MNRTYCPPGRRWGRTGESRRADPAPLVEVEVPPVAHLQHQRLRPHRHDALVLVVDEHVDGQLPALPALVLKRRGEPDAACRVGRLPRPADMEPPSSPSWSLHGPGAGVYCGKSGTPVCPARSFPFSLRLMNTTPVSLLVRLRAPGAPAWQEFVALYTPLLYTWARRKLGLGSEDAADLLQDVFVLLVRALPTFEYDATKGFRRWL